MSFELRPYQGNIIEEARALMRRGERSILIQSPTGSGKTVLVAHMIKTAAEKGMASWFNVHRRELIKQSTGTFGDVGVPHGVIANGFLEDPRHLVQIASVGTLAKRYDRLREPRLIVWDECHHIAAGSWSKIFSAFPRAFHVGLTATPERLDGKGLSKWFGKMIRGPKVSWLIEQGYLARYKLYAPSALNLGGVHTRYGEFVKSELNDIVDRPTITGDAIKHYRSLADGKRAVVFAVSVEHSKHIVEQFSAAGIPAAHVDGESDVAERDRRIASFRDGSIRILSNVELFGEGFDLPAMEVAILLRPTQSLGLYLQQVGRVLRASPGKTEAIILDHAGNVARHGLPDEDREWSLNGRAEREKNSRDGGPSVKICPRCFAAQFNLGRPKCQFCGHVFEIAARQVEQVDGELVEVDPHLVRRQRAVEQGGAESLEDLIALGKRRGYKRPEMWAKYVHRARQNKKLRGG